MAKLRQRHPDACAPSPAPANSALSAATYPPPPNTASASSSTLLRATRASAPRGVDASRRTI